MYAWCILWLTLLFFFHSSALSFLFSFLSCGLLGILIERSAYRPLRRSERLIPLISAIGVSIFLQNLVMLIASPESKPYPSMFPYFKILETNINSLQIFIIVLTIILMITLNLFIAKTRLGMAMRAVSQDRITSSLMGVNVNFIISLAFFIGGGLGGIAGFLNGLYYGSIKYNMGFIPGIKAFTAAVLGGIGNIKGAILGGYVLGILEAFCAGYISSENKDIFAFVVLILVLIF
ncbi:MAG: branched-chain amino acid ABC transporter permease, partial [bacterium]